MRYDGIDTVIVSGGMIRNDFALDFLKNIIKERHGQPVRLVAADKGLEFFRKNGLIPDFVDGDFDSLSEEGKRYLELLTDTKILLLKPEKDDTDTQSAVNLAMREGAKDILLLGATGSRLDHLMGNLGLLTMGKAKGVHIAIADANNYVTLIESGTVLKRKEQFGKFVSFFPVGGDVEELTLQGFKYPLCRHHLTVADCGLTVSNEISMPEATVSYSTGSLLMIMARD